MNQRPLVSVVIPAHDAAATIARALESVFAQHYEPIEILVVDDGSTDETANIVRRYASSGVKLIQTQGNKGAAAARNAGVRASTGEIIAFLDADDEWLADKLDKQVALFESDKNISLVFSKSNQYSASGRDLGDTYGGRDPAAGRDAWKLLLAVNSVATPTVLVRRKDMLDLGGFNPELKIGEDQDMWIRFALRGNLALVPESLVRVHARSDSLSNLSFHDQLQYTLPMIERHLTDLKDRLTPREIRRIRGERLGRLGRNAYNYGLHGEGFTMIVRSMLLGYRPIDALLHLTTSSPPAKWFKWLIGWNKRKAAQSNNGP